MKGGCEGHGGGGEGRGGEGGGEAAAEAAAQWERVLRAELQVVEELLELEPECKWPLLTAAWRG